MVVARASSTIIWALTSPIQAFYYYLHIIIECIKFPAMWANVLSRTIIFGYVTFWPIIEARSQFKRMCKEGRGVDGEQFSTRHAGALLDVLLPPELWKQVKNGQQVTKKYPVIVLYSGGAWILGRRLWMRPLLLHYADAGFIAVAADYRQWPLGTMKGMIKDALESISWTFDQIERPGSLLEHADADQVVVLGQSAGSHIASIAMLELAQIRKEQMMLVAQGVKGCDKPYLKSNNKGVPLAFVGVGGMFDLVSAVDDMHRKGLHRRVLESLCEGEPLINYCAKSRAEIVAEEARKRFVGNVVENEETGDVDVLTPSTSSSKKELPPLFANTEDSNTTTNNNSNTKNNNKKNKNKKNKSPDSGEVADKQLVSPTTDLDSTLRPSTAFAKTSNNKNQASLTSFNFDTHLQNYLNSSKSMLELEAEKVFRRLEGSSAVNFLPRFSLFVHGDDDISAPIDQAMRMCAAFNDAAARHPHELVGNRYRMEKRQPNFKVAEPFYILTPKPKPCTDFDTAVKKVVHQRAVSTSNYFSPSTLFPRDLASSLGDFSSLLSSFTKQLHQREHKHHQNEEKQDSSFQDVCDCYAGSRAIFMSYIKATHTTLIVDDFFIEETNPPLVCCVKALVSTLNELGDKSHLVETPAVSPEIADQNPSFEAMLRVVADGANGESNDTIINNSKKNSANSRKTWVAECSHCQPQQEEEDDDDETNVNPMINDDDSSMDSIQAINGRSTSQIIGGSGSSNSNGSSGNDKNRNNNKSKNHHRGHSRQISESFMPPIEDQRKNPTDYLCAPESIALPTDLFIRRFEKHYQEFESVNNRNPERPVITPFRRWLAQKVSAF